MAMSAKDPATDPTDLVKKIGSIYARWRAGEISQEDALFEIGDSLAELPAGELEIAKVQSRR